MAVERTNEIADNAVLQGENAAALLQRSGPELPALMAIALATMGVLFFMLVFAIAAAVYGETLSWISQPSLLRNFHVSIIALAVLIECFALGSLVKPSAAESPRETISVDLPTTEACEEQWSIRIESTATVHVFNLPQMVCSKPSDPECCAICLEEFDEDDARRWLPCFHSFHEGCINQWLSSKSSCPLCKHRVR